MNLKLLTPITIIGIILVVAAISFEDNSAPNTIFANSGESQNFEPLELEIMETNGVKHLIQIGRASCRERV